MVAPPSLSELFLIKKSSDMADEKAVELELKRKQLLAANKQKARVLLLGISSDGYVSTTVKHNWNGAK